MRNVETIIVGGGPAGSSCARELIRAGRECLVLEKTPMPRVKLCAGWITPKVLKDLEIDIATYPHGIVPLHRFRICLGAKPRVFNIPTQQYSIRRVEFDHWLLQRTGAETVPHRAQNIRWDETRYVIDEKFSCRFLIGAGGSNCPVRKTFFDEPQGEQILTKEVEYHTDAKLNSECTLWVPFTKKGYAWCVQKVGAVNIGYGGLASGIAPSEMNRHWETFTELLKQDGILNGQDPKPSSWFYYLKGAKQKITVKKNTAYIVGDAAGLATTDLGEGIGPAVESGILAARDILGREEYVTTKITRFSLPTMVPYLPAFLGRALLKLLISGC
jgi:flavin-dependent dehydrogenase